MFGVSVCERKGQTAQLRNNRGADIVHRQGYSIPPMHEQSLNHYGHD